MRWCVVEGGTALALVERSGEEESSGAVTEPSMWPTSGCCFASDSSARREVSASSAVWSVE